MSIQKSVRKKSSSYSCCYYYYLSLVVLRFFPHSCGWCGSSLSDRPQVNTWYSCYWVAPSILNQAWPCVITKIQQKWSCMIYKWSLKKALFLPWALGSLSLRKASCYAKNIPAQIWEAHVRGTDSPHGQSVQLPGRVHQPPGSRSSSPRQT